jgi:tetratricopeptide (TPR) repeat protein
MGVAYAQQGNTEKAIECCQKAIDIKPDNDFALHSLGWIYLKLGNLEEALKTLLKAWDFSKHKLEQAPMNLGHVFLLQGNHEKAIKWYQTSLSLWNNREAFFQGMESDFSDLVMERYGISQQDFKGILEALKK